MLEKDWLERFEQTAIGRNPSLATKLRPGLSEARIQRDLSRAKVAGGVAPIVALYTWKDGMDLTFESPAGIVPNFYEAEKAKMAFFPGKPYHYFLCLEMAIGHFGHLEAAAKNHPSLTEAVGRYFPVFWDGSTEWLSIDLKASNHNRVMIVQSRSDQPVREAYSSFDEFIADAIRANEENKPLRCFRKLQTK